MQTPQKKKFSGKYDPQLKLAIARYYFTGNLGYGSLAKKLMCRIKNARQQGQITEYVK